MHDEFKRRKFTRNKDAAMPQNLCQRLAHSKTTVTFMQQRQIPQATLASTAQGARHG
ncbi:hypothetical protein LP417_15655 [Polaromonas sp. P1-6]|nr:hypothetical protein LP417_15655 [Polaromonas sp. P1-6]